MYRIMIDFENEEDAKRCLDVLAYWEYPVAGIPYDIPEGATQIASCLPFDPPEKSFAVHSIKKVHLWEQLNPDKKEVNDD